MVLQRAHPHLFVSREMLLPLKREQHLVVSEKRGEETGERKSIIRVT